MNEFVPTDHNGEDAERDMRSSPPTDDACISERAAIAEALEVAIAFDRVPFLLAMLNCSPLPASQMADLIQIAGRFSRPRLQLVSLTDRMAAENIPNIIAEDGAQPARSAGATQTSAREAQPSDPQQPHILRADSRLLPTDHSGEGDEPSAA